MSDRSFVQERNLRQSFRHQDLRQDDAFYERTVRSHQQPQENRGQTDQFQTFAGWAIGISSSVFAEHILSHPCIVLRRQCQVHHNASWYHLTPFTLFHVIVNLERTQGLATLWKGIGSVFLAKGIFMVSETVISEVTPLPKEVSKHSPLKKHCQHLLLKGLSYMISTPFLAASLLETVQADVSSERPGTFDCLKEGVARVMGWWTPQTTHLLPVWKLVLPTAIIGVTSYTITQLAKYTVISTITLEEQESRANSSPVDGHTNAKKMYETFFTEMLASFTGNLLADMMTYPLETVIHRLYLQGTRTIIDNTDTGMDVIPISTRYEGVVDCFRDIVIEEGFSGLYKGFGAVILQYALHAAILRTAKFLFEKISQEFGTSRHCSSIHPSTMPKQPNQ
ncbi:solute carrier family 25 member 46-like isoform X1 [Mizuhopecten yessoensis]|uniref:Solute carrier family 25 member 46 n=1 Tax=Mizuhopecten yessoensis TaxID=6573 RepID=A0A210QM72_MIZYE|nr:solute carrier family 25 member 46-like isoform X1 [Mizuhopecten yessoensis]OWF49830.1 Solute carrier family 25 member 46 [Mizuhopecten yessoensis]